MAAARPRRPARPSRSGRRAGPPRRRPSSSPPSSSTVTGESPPRSTWATAAPDAPVPERHRLAHAALEDPRADHARRRARPERHVRAVGEAGRVLDRRADRRRGRALRARRGSSTRIAHCGLPIETCWKRQSRPPTSPRAVRRAARVVLRAQPRAAHVDAAGRRPSDRRADLARRPSGSRTVSASVQPRAAQVHDRLAGAVARQLGLRAVGVEDPQAGDEARLVGRRELEHAVGADPEVAVAQPRARARRVSANGSVRARRSGSRCPAPATSRTASAAIMPSQQLGARRRRRRGR